MTTVYRAYSPSRGHGTVPVRDRSRAVSAAESHNRMDEQYDLPCDWAVQTGHVQWETP